MIEQTELVVSKWNYTPPNNVLIENEFISSSIEFDVMKKLASNKKGIACRFTCTFSLAGVTFLTYVGENTYVIDLEDVIDAAEVMRMINNSYTLFSEKFEFKRLGTIVNNRSLPPINESLIDVNIILPLLN